MSPYTVVLVADVGPDFYGSYAYSVPEEYCGTVIYSPVLFSSVFFRFFSSVAPVREWRKVVYDVPVGGSFRQALLEYPPSRSTVVAGCPSRAATCTYFTIAVLPVIKYLGLCFIRPEIFLAFVYYAFLAL